MECRTKKDTDTGRVANGTKIDFRTDSVKKTVKPGPVQTRGKTILGPARTGTEILPRSWTSSDQDEYI